MRNELEHRLKEVEEEKKMVVAAEKKILKLKAFEIAVKKLSEADIAAIMVSFKI